MDEIERLTKWIWLSLACGAGSSVPETLYSAFGDIDAIYESTEEEYISVDDKISCLPALCDKSLDRAMHILKWCEMKRVGVIAPDDPLYPVRLYETHSFPCVLYTYGKIPNIDDHLAVACVGTRKMTEYGKNNAYAISRDLAKEGAVIVSGLALGIDAVCHRAALDAGGLTVAVLGCGLDRAYPPQNRDLMIEIARKGTIFTEFAPFSEPVKANFPIRNRIISGLSNAAMVFEADANSGSLITARYARKQGRPVYALPGNAGNLTSVGTNELLTEGYAKAAVRAGDILYDFKDVLERTDRKKPAAPREKKIAAPVPDAGIPADLQNGGTPSPEPVPEPPKTEQVPLSKEKSDKLISELSLLETTVYNILTLTDPLNCEQLRIRTSLPVNKIMAALTMLEVKKLILPMPGGGYVRVR
ncbi:MAG: DNA-processing protein DprA [Clostridia bacterium]|nr:DNA-processing protein DprA [Clostridia bacterium]